MAIYQMVPQDMMVWVEAIVPYGQGDLVNIIHRLGIVDQEVLSSISPLVESCLVCLSAKSDGQC